MERRYGRGFDAVAKEELWDRWRRGESLKAIGRAFGKPSSSIYFQVSPHGGIRPRRRRRSRLALTFAEREEISRGIAAARSLRAMARLLGHAPSTVSREIRRNGGYARYRAVDRRAQRGLGKPESFSFLGFTFICGKSRQGIFQLKRKTRRDRMRAKLRATKQEMRRRMHQPIPVQGKWLQPTLIAGGMRAVSWGSSALIWSTISMTLAPGCLNTARMTPSLLF